MPLLLFLFVLPALAIDRTTTSGPLTLRLTTDRDEMIVSDRLRLELRVSTPSGARAEIADPGPKLGGFTIVSRAALPPSPTVAGGLTTGVVFTLEPFLAGDYEIPAIRINCIDASGTTTELLTDALTIPVRSLLGEDEEAQPAPVRGLVDPPRRPTFPRLWIIGPAAAVAIVGGLIARHVLRPRRGSNPFASALARLEPLRERDTPLGAEQADEIIAVFRAALASRGVSNASQLDSDAIVAAAERSHALTAAELDSLRSLLARCDALRFGGETATNPARGDIEAAIAICKALARPSGGGA